MGSLWSLAGLVGWVAVVRVLVVPVFLGVVVVATPALRAIRTSRSEGRGALPDNHGEACARSSEMIVCMLCVSCFLYCISSMCDLVLCYSFSLLCPSFERDAVFTLLRISLDWIRLSFSCKLSCVSRI